MIVEVKCCRECQSENLVKNGCNNVGNPKYKCKNCGFGGVFQTLRKNDEFKETVVKLAQQERASSRGLARGFGISHQTVLNLIKKKPNRSLTS